jgi:hypothetical protein
MSGLVRYILVGVGALLLLPGLCSLYFIFEFARTSGNVLDLGGLFLIVWGGTFIIAVLGVWLMRAALKKPA